jgi:hypothetical protein
VTEKSEAIAHASRCWLTGWTRKRIIWDKWRVVEDERLNVSKPKAE